MLPELYLLVFVELFLKAKGRYEWGVGYWGSGPRPKTHQRVPLLQRETVAAGYAGARYAWGSGSWPSDGTDSIAGVST
jgi:hypothetical protein